MDCASCGNHLPEGDTVCQTCGTPRPEVAVEGAQHFSPAEHAVATAGGSAVSKGLVIAVVAGLALALGLVFVLVAMLLSSRSDGPEIAVGAPNLAGAPDWPPANVVGSLPPHTEPDSSLGQLAPAVDGYDFDGNAVLIEDNGRPKVIVFLAHWCPHCQAEVPVMQAYLDRNGVPDGVEFIAVATSIDDQRPNYPPDAWLHREGWTSPVIVDPDLAVSSAYGLSAYPFYVFVRDDFTVDFRITGELDPAAVFDYTETLFGPAAVPSQEVFGPSDHEAAVQQPTACDGAAPEPRQLVTFDEPGAADPAEVLTFVTSCGEIRIELDAEAAPETVNSMLFLAARGYFNGTICHRLVPGFVLQCGDPTGTGTGSPGYVVVDEFPESGAAYAVGAVAMANSGPGTTGSQFFVIIGDATFLPPQFTIIGKVSEIQPLIAALDTVPLGTSPGGEVSIPLETIYIEAVRVGG